MDSGGGVNFSTCRQEILGDRVALLSTVYRPVSCYQTKYEKVIGSCMSSG